MATGDVTISVSVEGGVTKSVVLDSATRVLSCDGLQGPGNGDITDVEWQVLTVNKLGNVILARVNSKVQAAASWTPKTFTAAS